MKPNWTNRTFDELLDFFDRQRIPLSSSDRANRKGPYPYYGASGIIDSIDAYIFDGTYLLISEDGENLNSRKTPIAFRASGKFWVNNHAHIVKGKGGIADDRFLEYLIAHLDLSGFITGTAQPKLSQENLRKVTAVVPDCATQTRIASILAAYDDLIENNTRRIKILGEMAQMLYREWFVNFRFPGHKKVRMDESGLGPIPKGWQLKSLREVTSHISRGLSPQYDDSAESWVINQKCIRDHQLNLGPSRRQSKPVPVEKLLRKGDILINSTGVGTLGRVAQVHRELANYTADSHVTILRPSADADYLGEVAIQLEPEFEAAGIGSTGQTELGRERIANTQFVCPTESLRSTFSRYAADLHQLSSCLLRKNEILRTTRDLLLPKLISGEIPVEAADDTAAELMEAQAQPA